MFIKSGQLVPMPGRTSTTRKFIDLATKLNTAYGLDMKLTHREQDICVEYIVPLGESVCAMRNLFAMADDISFVKAVGETSVSIALLHYTHATLQDGMMIAPDGRIIDNA